ncbi:sodium/potassium/calcium exchanger 2-like [Branchiostoma lanceolatum]|uniref:sodium/potassium/calcium exchanger 2-like n=1 Tax=Branchiostoma lanceolatum TaxID=7740 RepID=UPI0034558136
MKQMRYTRRAKWDRLLGTLAVVAVGYLCLFFSISTATDDGKETSRQWQQDVTFRSRTILSTNSTSNSSNTTTDPIRKGVYPPDVFDLAARRNGAVVLHILGMMYMFAGMAVVCDEFFVPALTVIVEKLEISEDVAGATFMAAGGSAPEFFLSLFGVFFATGNVGTGTIVGSAVFNILFVIGACAVFSKEVLTLTWWPLLRDTCFYILSLGVLIIFFHNGEILWWQSLCLLTIYLLYVLFMKYSNTLERTLKNLLNPNRVHVVVKEGQRESQHFNFPVFRSNSGLFRHGALQLLIHTIDPIGEAKISDKAKALYTITKVQVVMENEVGHVTLTGDQEVTPINKTSNMATLTVRTLGLTNPSCDTLGDSERPSTSQENLDMSEDSRSLPLGEVVKHSGEKRRQSSSSVSSQDGTGKKNGTIKNGVTQDPEEATDKDEEDEEEEEEKEEPLDMSWPDTCKKRVPYIIMFPLVFMMWITLPDVRKPSARRFYPWGFLGSIIWISIFSYLMLWWANQTGDTMGLSIEVMGLTVLAAGTSVPDLITSVLVARRGFGDMAVSSSIGSNIFDITIGLPVPWLLYACVYNGRAVDVNSRGLFCSILMLLAMLVCVIVTIAACRWRMNRVLGIIFFTLYLVFMVLSVLLELDIIKCFV